MAPTNINKRGLSRSAPTNDYEIWSGFTGFDMETQRTGHFAHDTLVVLLIAAITLCGAALVAAALWMTLH